jgi:carotenoid cleavage dioxygenase
MSVRFTGPMANGPFAPVRAEIDLVDCEVEGKLPSDLSGTFYRVGPDFQYPPRLPNIPLDGEGHIGMFRIENGHVDYKSRFVRTQRYMRRPRRASRCLAPIAIHAATIRACGD